MAKVEIHSDSKNFFKALKKFLKEAAKIYRGGAGDVLNQNKFFIGKVKLKDFNLLSFKIKVKGCIRCGLKKPGGTGTF